MANNGPLLPPVEHKRAGSVDIILGVQWGDEGKGRVVDLLARDYAIVARFGGGDNAGHSIEVGEQKLALRIVPSGALVPSTKLHIGAGTVVALRGLVTELDAPRENRRRHLAHHDLRPRANRVSVSRHARSSGRASARRRGDRHDRSRDRSRLRRPGRPHRRHLRRPAQPRRCWRKRFARRDGRQGLDPGRRPGCSDRGERHRRHARARRSGCCPHVVDGVAYINEALERGRAISWPRERRGTLLDITYGSYPYVTSSSTIAGGACIGLGIGPRRGTVGDRDREGVLHARRRRSVPLGASGRRGRTSARGRAASSASSPAGRAAAAGSTRSTARYAARVNGLDRLIVTKLDVLSGFDRIGLVTGYRHADGSPAGIEAMGEPGLADRDRVPSGLVGKPP